MGKSDYIKRLQRAIKDRHNFESVHVESMHVRVAFKDQTVWDGVVEIFEVQGDSRAKRCYAWGAFGGKLGEKGPEKEEFYAVPELLPVTTAEEAVRTAISSDPKSFNTQPGKIYKVTCIALERGKNILIESDLIFESDGKRAFIVLEWWADAGHGEVPKLTVEIDPVFLRRPQKGKIDFFYQGQISMPQAQHN